MSGLIRHLAILQSHVFLLNSRLGHFSAANPEELASFFPKLQDKFAEFLSRGSLERLSILNPTTCVRLEYELHISLFLEETA